ncbi:hypothetical protein K9N68_01690 [Kovacikia minuta CCNUW1]|uniref:hypothetical protein n=1 Tax=Kovacikia minuta TaxID=2931930 RepID=UPI001CC9B8C1|nr:hypothetical protein [Kovacikia minuta]UBF26741.1 hypothetical protein K9N68_01690 [Kovacikia minuta CCNUW1]
MARADSPPVRSEQVTQPQFIRPRVTCPGDVETLTKAMLKDLPSYVNRAYLRTLGQRPGGISYAIAASQPDFMPLPTVSSEYANPLDPHLHQIFFTMLERQYLGQQMAELQNYHWLFLSQTPEGWQIALMYSRFGSYPAGNQPVTAPQDSSQSLTAQAIRTWLRDCQAGAVRL